MRNAIMGNDLNSPCLIVFSRAFVPDGHQQEEKQISTLCTSHIVMLFSRAKIHKLMHECGQIEIEGRVVHLILRALAIRASNPQNALAQISFVSPKILPSPHHLFDHFVIFYFYCLSNINDH